MGIFDLLKPNPEARLKKEIRRLSTEAMHLQRNGKIPELAQMTKRIAVLEERLEAVHQQNSSTGGPQ